MTFEEMNRYNFHVYVDNMHGAVKDADDRDLQEAVSVLCDEVSERYHSDDQWYLLLAAKALELAEVAYAKHLGEHRDDFPKVLDDMAYELCKWE